MKRHLYLLIPVLYALFFTAQAQDKATRKNIKALDAYYQQALEDWQVPGMAIAIVKDGEVVLSSGYGLRTIGQTEKVDDQTLFAIASNTKAFTSAALGILVDEQKINWNDPITKHLPGFRLYDPYVSQNITIRDALCHRSGLKTFSGDLLWYASNYSRKEVIRRARFLQPKYGFRTQFGYSNILYLTCGEIIPAATGTSWDDFLNERIFKPLKMQRTYTSLLQLDGIENIASPHTDFEEQVIPIPYINWDNIAPAGSIISCVSDISQWIRLQLNHGILGQDTIFSPAAQREMWSPQIPLPISKWAENRWPSTHFKAYGLGWQLYDYHGYKIVTHNGGADGMISQTVLVPEANLGFVILTNKSSSLYFPLIFKTLDTFLSDEQTDWSRLFLDMKHSGGKQELTAQTEDKTKPCLELSAYAGTYSGSLYGDATIQLKDGQLQLQMVPTPTFHSTLQHKQFNTFTIRFPEQPSLPEGTINFILDKEGKVEAMHIDVPNPDFDFTELTFKKQ